MERIAKNIKRTRFLIEGYLEGPIDQEDIEGYFDEAARLLKLRRSGHALEFSKSKNSNHLNFFCPLEDLGLFVHYWKKEAFVSVILISCTPIDEKQFQEETRQYFRMKESLAKDF